MNSQNLQQHQWKNRVVIVKTAQIDAEIYNAQVKEFKDKPKEMADRKLVLYTIQGDNYQMIDFSSSDDQITGNIKNGFKDSLFNPDSDFEVILIGLDGGVKLRQNTILTKEKLFSTIDAMPMRKAETKRNKHKN
ncbi:MAG: DUF4174 domain-containing protein [Flavobacteriaceae bacterium]|nr:DUF4174 domain-containing protein [Flavobacteriaceae bacterium]